MDEDYLATLLDLVGLTQTRQNKRPDTQNFSVQHGSFWELPKQAFGMATLEEGELLNFRAVAFHSEC